jgi:TonB family protein
MRNTATLRTLRTCRLLTHIGVFICVLIPGLTQEPAPAPMPRDAKGLMLLATKTNGLSGPDVQPWHLKASYQLFDQQGNSIGKGTYEEFWVSPAKFKQIIASDTLTETRFGTEKGIMAVGSQTQFALPLPWQLNALRRDLTNPLPSASSLDTQDFAEQPDDGNNGHTRCISVSGPAHSTRKADGTITYSEERRNLGVYCFERETPTLETHTEGAGAKTTFSNPVMLQGRYLPRDLERTVNGQVALSAHLDVIENINPVIDADFTPPPDAIPVTPIKLIRMKGDGPATDAAVQTPNQVNVSGGVAQGLLSNRVSPVYPAVARAARVQGIVILQALIGKDGQVKELSVVSGPPLLQSAAIDAVKQWVYRPYLLNGDPVEVMTTVNVVFTLGEPPAKP